MTRVSLYCRGSAERTGTIYQVSVYRYCTHRQPQTIKIILNACTRHISLPRQKIKKVFFSYLPSVLESKYKIIKKKIRSFPTAQQTQDSLLPDSSSTLVPILSCMSVCVCVLLLFGTLLYKVPTTLQNLEASIGTHHGRTRWHIFLRAREKKLQSISPPVARKSGIFQFSFSYILRV
jgi:hypothetical protein